MTISSIDGNEASCLWFVEAGGSMKAAFPIITLKLKK